MRKYNNIKLLYLRLDYLFNNVWAGNLFYFGYRDQSLISFFC